MKALLSVIFMLALQAGFHSTFAQPEYREVTKATTAFDDAKPNSDSVPAVIASYQQSSGLLILRFKYGSDLLGGMEEALAKEGIKNAVILSGIGSVQNYHIHAVSNNTFPSKNIYVMDKDSPADLCSVNGYVLGGRVHAHVTLSDRDGAFGGHLEHGTSVFTFAIITLALLDPEAELDWVDDKTYR